jgi:hypothetical protein
MRFPEDTPARRVKCPSCGNVFLPAELANKAAPATRREPRPDDDRDDDRPRRRDRDDDDDDRDDDRRTRRRDDGRGRRRRDDDRDDRPSRRRRDADDDYDDDRSRRRRPDPSAAEGQFNRASLACLLNFIGGWLLVAALALLAFVWFLDWVGVNEGLRIFLVLAGLLGLGHWLTSATGLGFLVSGPRDRGALGLSIATAAVAGLHILLLIVIATSRNFGGFGTLTPGRAADVHWDAFVTQARALPVLLFGEIGIGDLWRDVSSGSLVPVLANLAEVARMIMYLLTLRAVMRCARDSRGASIAMRTMIGYAIGAGALILVGVLFGLLMLAVRPSGRGPSDRESLSAVIHLFFLIMYLALAGLAVGTTLITRVVKGKIDYRR